MERIQALFFLLQPGREEVPLQAKNIADIDRIG